MKKNVIYIGILFAAAACFLIYFYGFTRSEAENLSLTVFDGIDAGWEISALEKGEELPVTPAEAVSFDGTVVLQRTIPDDWAQYGRVEVDSNRAISVFVEDAQVFSNHKTALIKPGELPLMQKSGEQPFSLVFTFDPGWVGKNLTVVTRLYENEPFDSIGFTLINDAVLLAQHEAWVNSKAIPGGMFALLSLLLLGLFIFQHATDKKGYAILLLALSSLLQMFIAMGSLQENPFPLVDQNLATAVYFLIPLLYLGTKFTTMKKRYFIAAISLWSVYFILYMALFVFQLPLPYWMDKIELVCFFLIAIMLYCCIRERKHNAYAKQFLRLLGVFFTGYLLLFAVTAVANPHLHEYIIIIAWREASALYCRPLLYWIFTTILIVLFILAVWEVLQSKIRSVRDLNEMKLHSSLMAQSLTHAEKTNEALAIMRHDEVFHLRTLGQYISEDVDKAREYVDSLTQTLAQIPTMRFTKNRLVNSILSAQFISASEQEVELITKVNIAEELALSSHDITTVLMNLLDNAVTAAAKTDSKKVKPLVSVNLEQDADMLYITISNSLPEDFDKQNLYNIAFGAIRSSAEAHGWGIRSVKNILSNYGAELGYQIDDKITVSTVMQFQD